MAEQVAAGLDAYIDHFLEHPHAVLAVNRGALSGDPAVQGLIERELRVLQERMLGGLGLTGPDREVAALALHGWLAFARAACVEFVQRRRVSKDELRALCLRSLVGALGSTVRLDDLPHPGGEQQR